ncbi:MAG: methyltransferase domain-containing protein [Thermodesulfobacteriota bacterium]|nr:methyltransferase domain-containing protein [Thermodesulfobacteriota bacterium]
MQYSIRFLVEEINKAFNLIEPIYEIGSFLVEGQEDLADLRPLFADKTYIGCDIREGKGVDRIEDAEKLSMDDGSVGTVLILETLEHVQNPFLAFREIYRVLMDDGVVVVSSVMDFEIHDHPNDYWRFTPEAFKLLLKEFPNKIIISQGDDKFPLSIIGIGFKSPKVKIKDADVSKMIGNFTEKYNKYFQLTVRGRIKLFLARLFRMYETERRLVLSSKIRYQIVTA